MAARAPQEAQVLTARDALAFVERHGIVCEASRRGTVPSLADAIAGKRVRGSWWSHRYAQRIFELTRAVRAAPEILVCRLVDGRITFVHERLWPALVRLAERIPGKSLARLREVHGASGKHIVEETPFPAWLPGDAITAAASVAEAEARNLQARIGRTARRTRRGG